MSSLFHLRINNKISNFTFPLTIFQACLEKKVYIPRFCYHVSLKIAGNCRMCLIEEKASIKPLASCAITIANGMQIFTNTEVVKKAREGVLEYLLINHPLDCPICDQGGECDLQDQTMVFGSDKGRFYDLKRSTPNKNLGFFVKTFLNRCIHCARCTRFLADLAGTHELQLVGRGLQTEIGTYTNRFLTSEVSGNIIDLCPVGALTSKPYAFKARVWELISFYTHDIMDGFASNIQVDFRGLTLLRILPKTNKLLNDEWISDKTRFFYDSLNIQRLTNPYFFLDPSFYFSLNWINSLVLFKNYLLSFFYSSKELNYKQRLQHYFSFGDFIDLETSLYSKYFNKKTGFSFYSSRSTFKNDSRSAYSTPTLEYISHFANPLSGYSLFFLNTNLRYESPIFNLKLKKSLSFFNLTPIVFGFISNFNYPFLHFSRDITKKVLNRLNSTRSILIKGWISGDFTFNLFQSNTISKNISNISLAEISLIPKSELSFSFINFFFSDLKLKNTPPLVNQALSINFFHHMEEDQTSFTKTMLLPTKFFLEKASSYCSNSIFFFNTHNPFSYNIPNTKDEWKIINAFFEYTFGSAVLNKDTEISIRECVPRLKYLNLPFSFTKFDNKFIGNYRSVSSSINNFFSTNIITRLSKVLSLASKKLTILNDYKFLNLC